MQPTYRGKPAAGTLQKDVVNLCMTLKAALTPFKADSQS